MKRLLYLLSIIVIFTPNVTGAVSDQRRNIERYPFYDNTAEYANNCSAAGSAPAGAAAPLLPVSLVDIPQKAMDVFNAQKATIELLRPQYESAATKAGIDWAVIAAIHYREGGNSPTKSVYAGEPIGSTNPDHNTKYGTTLQENLDLGALSMKSFAKDFYGVTLLPNGNSIDDLEKLFIAWNRGGLYKKYNQPIDSSPYVMNYYSSRYLAMHFPDTLAEPASTRGKADSRPGALIMYTLIKQLIGSGGATGGSTSTGGCPATGASSGVIDTNLVAQIIALAQQELAAGIKEADGSYLKYTMGRNENWCADFVSWILKEAGQPFTGGMGGGWDIASVDSVQAWFQKQGRFIPAGQTPQPGDIVIYNTAKFEPVSHVNIVISVNGDTITVIGGNQSNKVTQQTKKITDKAISGYGRP